MYEILLNQMKEIEVKAKINNINIIKAKLIKMGCSFSEPLIQRDVIFLHNSMKFKDFGKGKVILRIRNSNGIFMLTLKKQLENELDNIEKEIIVNDPIQTQDILEYMGYHEVVRVNKNRLQCRLDGVTICLDEVEKLGSFIEVEKITDENNSMEVQKNLYNLLESLGIQKEARVFKGYDTLIEELVE